MVEIEKITQIHNFFKEYIFGFMFHDINTAIDGKANFLAALGLMEYTEIIGGFVTGELRKKKSPKKNFNAFLPYLGQFYIDIDKEIVLYERIRCGLAHEYFIKGSATIWMSSDNPLSGGIIYEKDKDWVHFVVTKYFEDFKSAVEIYHGQLVFEKNKDLISKFSEALANSAEIKTTTL